MNDIKLLRKRLLKIFGVTFAVGVIIFALLIFGYFLATNIKTWYYGEPSSTRVRLGTVTDSEVIEADRLIRLLPNNLVEEFFSNGGIIYLFNTVDYKLTDAYGAMTESMKDSLDSCPTNASAFISRDLSSTENKGYIFVKTDGIDDSLLHEFGHYVDFNAQYSSTPTFYKIMIDNFDILADYNNMSSNFEHYKSAKEFFAEAFSIVVETDSFRARYKELYEYYDIILEQYS